MARERHVSDHYAALGIEVRDHISIVSPSMIKQAYRKSALYYHPDRGNVSNDSMFKALNVAQEVLLDSSKRRDYDSWYVRYFNRAYVTNAIIERVKSCILNNEPIENKRNDSKESSKQDRFSEHQEESFRKAQEEMRRRRAESQRFHQQREEINKAREEYIKRAAYEDKIKNLFIIADIHPNKLTKAELLTLLGILKRRSNDSIKNYLRLKKQARLAHNRAEAIDRKSRNESASIRDGLGKSGPNRAEARQYEEEASQMEYTVRETRTKFIKLKRHFKSIYDIKINTNSDIKQTDSKKNNKGSAEKNHFSKKASDPDESSDFSDLSDYSDYEEFESTNSHTFNDKYTKFTF